MTPWKLPLIVAALVLPVVAGFMAGGAGVGVAAGALVALALVVFALRQESRGPIGRTPSAAPPRRILLVVTQPVEEPGAVESVAREVGAGSRAEVLVLAPAGIGFLDRWASDLAEARRLAQEKLVATVAALAKVGIAAEARVGDEDIVQAVEDQLGSYPADEVLMVSRAGDADGAERAADELASRLRAEFRHLRLDGV